MARILARTFWEKFKPIQNHLRENASLDGCMFETYGPELEFILSKIPDQTVWTFLDCGTIGSGYHFVNRMGYLITTKKAPEFTYFRT